jgi:hypothetical protein
VVRAWKGNLASFRLPIHRGRARRSVAAKHKPSPTKERREAMRTKFWLFLVAVGLFLALVSG